MSHSIRRYLLALALLAGCVPAADVARTAVPPSVPFPLPVVVLVGTPAAIGLQHGKVLSASIHTLHDQYLLKFIGSPIKRMVALSLASAFESKMRPEHESEVIALAKGSAEDEQETVLAQCFLDLAQLSGCSTVALPAGASPDRVPRFGRNLDFRSLDVADKYTTVFVVKPTDGRYAFASVGWPGMAGVLSGMNEHGLCLANMEVPRGQRLPSAMPYTLLYRTVMERCRTVDEAIDLLDKTPIQTANNLMLMDAAGGRAAVELSPDFVHVRRGRPGEAVVSTNHQRDQDRQTPGRCDRYDYLETTSRSDFGRIDESAVQAMLRHVGNTSTLQSMVFEPTTRVIYLSSGQSAATKTFSRLDLAPYFAK